jgi:DOPA 4,5-dioxygenase
LINIPGPKSSAYDKFPEPIKSENNGFDFHSEQAEVELR